MKDRYGIVKKRYFKFWYYVCPKTFWIVKQIGKRQARVIYSYRGHDYYDSIIPYHWQVGEILWCIENNECIFGSESEEITEDDVKLIIL